MSALTDPWAPRGQVASSGTQNTSTGTITTTETVYAAINDVSSTILAGRRYKVTLTVYGFSSVLNDRFVIRLRDGGGSAPTNASTLVYEINCVQNGAASVEQCFTAVFEWVPSTGTHRLGVFGLRTAGTGNVSVGSAVAGRLSDLIVEDVGLGPA